MRQQADIVVVGGGPIGLWTSVQTKLRNPDKKIVILEKYPDYQRSNNLKLDLSSLEGIPQDRRLKAIVKEWKEIVKRQGTLPTNVIENKLKKLSQELDIKIITPRHVTDPIALENEFSDTTLFIAADGAHSLAREALFGKEDQFASYETLQYIAEIKYQVEGDGEAFKKLTEAYRTLKLAGCVATEHVGKTKNGLTPITLRLFIDKKTYEKIAPFTQFKKPCSLNDPRLDPELKRQIMTWLNAKELIKKEKRLENSVNITTTHLSAYEAKAFVMRKPNGKIWCIVGDAAIGVPFFRSMRNGLLCGTELSKALTAFFANRNAPRPVVKRSVWQRLWQKGSEDPFSAYSRFAHRLARWETFIAKMKNFFIRFYFWFVQISGKVPWQINKWSYVQARQFRLNSSS